MTTLKLRCINCGHVEEREVDIALYPYAQLGLLGYHAEYLCSDRCRMAAAKDMAKYHKSQEVKP